MCFDDEEGRERTFVEDSFFSYDLEDKPAFAGVEVEVVVVVAPIVLEVVEFGFVVVVVVVFGRRVSGGGVVERLPDFDEPERTKFFL